MVMMILGSLAAYASVDVSHECVSALCLEDEPVTFVITLSNRFNESINVYSADLIDRRTDQIIGSGDVNYYVVPDGTAHIRLTFPVGLPPSGISYSYYPCLEIAFSKEPNEIYSICQNVNKMLVITPRSEVDCIEDDHCHITQFCDIDTYTCVNLNCSGDEAQLPHRCLPLACPEGFEAVDHVCFKEETDESRYSAAVMYGVLGLLLLVIILLVILMMRSSERSSGSYIQKTVRKKRRRRR